MNPAFRSAVDSVNPVPPMSSTKKIPPSFGSRSFLTAAGIPAYGVPGAWFDPDGKDPDSSTAGAWCHIYGGRRYRTGSFPTEPLPLRDKQQCIASPPRGQQG